MKKVLALALALVLAVSVFPFASAATKTISVTWVPITSNEFVVDTLNGVPAVYAKDGNIQCNEFAIRYYEEIYGVYMFVGVVPPMSYAGDHSYRALAAAESPQTGDIVWWSAEQNNGRNEHTALVKSYENGVITLIEQNWSWTNGGVKQAAKDRKIAWNPADFTVYRLVADIPSTWAREDMIAAYNAGILTEDTVYGFQENITRRQFCELVVNIARKMKISMSAPAQSPFADVDSEFVTLAYNLGIVTGRSATEFAPNANITREEMAVMLLRMMEKLGKTAPSEAEIDEVLGKFTDGGGVSSWARRGMAFSNLNGYIRGSSDTTLSPKGNTTKEQAVVMLMRIYNSN